MSWIFYVIALVFAVFSLVLGIGIGIGYTKHQYKETKLIDGYLLVYDAEDGSNPELHLGMYGDDFKNIVKTDKEFAILAIIHSKSQK